MEKLPLMQQDKLQQVIPQLAGLCTNLQPFERDRDDVPSKEQANSVIRSIVEEDQVDDLMDQAFVLGGAMFTASLNYIIAHKLMRNKKWYADHILMKNGKHRTFQATQKLTDLRKLLMAKAEHAPQQPGAKGKRSFTAMLEELDDDEDDHTPSTPSTPPKKGKTTKRGTKRTRVIEDSSNEDN